MEGFLAIIVLVFGVLQIILFFKLWGMTNNVRKLTEHFAIGSDYASIGDKVRLAKMQGRTKEQIQTLLAENMANEIIEGYNKAGGVEDTVKKWEQIFKNAGIDMPDHLKQIKTYEDVISLYSEEEWEELFTPNPQPFH